MELRLPTAPRKSRIAVRPKHPAAKSGTYQEHPFLTRISSASSPRGPGSDRSSKLPRAGTRREPGHDAPRDPGRRPRPVARRRVRTAFARPDPPRPWLRPGSLVERPRLLGCARQRVSVSSRPAPVDSAARAAPPQAQAPLPPGCGHHRPAPPSGLAQGVMRLDRLGPGREGQRR